MRWASANQTLSFMSWDPIDEICSALSVASLSRPETDWTNCSPVIWPDLYAPVARGSACPAIVPPVASTRIRGRLATVPASLLASAACAATLTNDQNAKVITGNESIDIQLCPRRAGLTLCFLIGIDLLFLQASIVSARLV